ncbi:SPRY domain-containing protein [Lederbergia citrisecunda]|uniref:SPRY domain-containing protein n=1 Tax=Lederbergia citrisecunda TaxID=2833583 RepID=UPI003D2E27AC
MEKVSWDTVNKGVEATLSNDNLTAIIPNSSNTVRTNYGKTSGKWYWEIKTIRRITGTVNIVMIGIVNSDVPLTAVNISNQNVRYYYSSNGNKFPEAVSYGDSYAMSNAIGVALDLDNGTLEFYKNGVSQGVSHTNIKELGKVFPAVTLGGTIASFEITANFGDSPFDYPIPSGFRPYNAGRQHKILLSSDSKVKILKTEDFAHKVSMTSNVLPSPLVSSSSTAQGVAYDPWRAFDGFTDRAGWRTAASTPTGWIQLDFGESKKVSYFSMVAIYGNASPATAPKNFKLQGSNDELGFTTVKEFTNETGWSTGEFRRYDLGVSVSYRYYRVDTTENNSGSYLSINNIFFGYKEASVLEVPSQSEKTSINHGMSLSDLSSTDMSSEFIEKHYIQDEATPLGEGKVFKHDLDATKTIKKMSVK